VKKNPPGAVPHPARYDASRSKAHWWMHCSPKVATILSDWLAHCLNGETEQDEDGTIDTEWVPIPKVFADWLRDHASQYIDCEDIDCEPGHETEPYVILNQGMVTLMGLIMATRVRENDLEAYFMQHGPEALSEHPAWDGYLPRDPARQ